jgi:NAD+ synthase (glutamine-hydrolysing)
MGTENSSEETNSRAQRLAGHFGAYHSSIVIDDIIASMLNVFGVLTGGVLPKFAAYGGTKTQDLALQNIQARLRMVMSYMLAQLIPWIRQIRSDPIQMGFLLVLGSGNVDEALRGYLTKYDCSSADLNPIGGICKNDLKRLLLWGEQVLQCPTLGDIVNAPPTAELQPLAGASEEAVSSSSSDSVGTGADTSARARIVQNDEEDMGMTYAELGVFGFLRKVQQCGPLTMFYKLCDMWGNTLNPSEIAAKVKRFFLYYSINRHKLTTLTPSYHAENYSPDDNRFDLRPILYNTSWRRQFNNIDAVVQMKEGENADASSLTEIA